MFRLLQSLIGSQGGRVPLASRGQRPRRRQAKHSARSAATLRAGAQSKRPKSAKGVWGKTRVFPHKQHIKSSCTYPPKQSGGLFRKNITHLNYSLPPNIITIAISSIYMIHKFVPQYYRYLYKIINFT